MKAGTMTAVVSAIVVSLAGCGSTVVVEFVSTAATTSTTATTTTLAEDSSTTTPPLPTTTSTLAPPPDTTSTQPKLEEPHIALTLADGSQVAIPQGGSHPTQGSLSLWVREMMIDGAMSSDASAEGPLCSVTEADTGGQVFSFEQEAAVGSICSIEVASIDGARTAQFSIVLTRGQAELHVVGAPAACAPHGTTLTSVVVETVPSNPSMVLINGFEPVMGSAVADREGLWFDSVRTDGPNLEFDLRVAVDAPLGPAAVEISFPDHGINHREPAEPITLLLTIAEAC